MTIHSVLHILLANTFKHISCPVRLSLHVMAATRRSKIWSRHCLTKHHQHNSLSEHWNFTPPLNHWTISQLLVIYNILETSTAKLGRCWEKNPRIKHPDFRKTQTDKIWVQMIVLFISGWFSGLLLLDGWMVVSIIFTTSQSHYYQDQDETRDL